ncbi:MAG: hypothetical protein F9K44_02045 [Hyphomicrobiaceae bacterium]|nr:MAG: hypothetical protein F9K44_02045 [Hyphomicrobiaceae bacterium]
MFSTLSKRIAVPAAALAFALVAPAAEAQFQGPKTFRTVEGPDANSVVFLWDGNVQPGMAQEISQAFDQWKGRVNRVIFSINSLGGSVAEGDAVIRVFQDIKRTHRLDTHVGRGRQCGSMCVPLFMQGQERLGARTSSWLFHEIANFDNRGQLVTLLPERTDRFFNTYFKPFGVPDAWIASVKSQIKGNDLWQTGDDLIKAQANIITSPLENLNMRIVSNPQTPNQQISQPRQAPVPPSTSQTPNRPTQITQAPNRRPAQTGTGEETETQNQPRQRITQQQPPRQPVTQLPNNRRPAQTGTGDDNESEIEQQTERQTLRRLNPITGAGN